MKKYGSAGNNLLIARAAIFISFGKFYMSIMDTIFV